MRPVEARYEDGFLKPAKPLLLKPGERVGLIVLRRPDAARWDLKRIAQSSEEDTALAEAGIEAWSDELDGEELP